MISRGKFSVYRVGAVKRPLSLLHSYIYVIRLLKTSLYTEAFIKDGQ